MGRVGNGLGASRKETSIEAIPGDTSVSAFHPSLPALKAGVSRPFLVVTFNFSSRAQQLMHQTYTNLGALECSLPRYPRGPFPYLLRHHLFSRPCVHHQSSTPDTIPLFCSLFPTALSATWCYRVCLCLALPDWTPWGQEFCFCPISSAKNSSWHVVMFNKHLFNWMACWWDFWWIQTLSGFLFVLAIHVLHFISHCIREGETCYFSEVFYVMIGILLLWLPFMVNFKNIQVPVMIASFIHYGVTTIVALEVENYSNNDKFKIRHYSYKAQKVIRQGPWP